MRRLWIFLIKKCGLGIVVCLIVGKNNKEFS